MNISKYIFVFFMLLLTSGCSSTQQEDTAARYLAGSWSVGVRAADGSIQQLGTLEISDNIYNYHPIPQTQTPAWMAARFSFINNLSGSVNLASERFDDNFQTIVIVNRSLNSK